MSKVMNNSTFQQLLTQRANCKYQQANPYCSFRLLREADLWDGRFDSKELSGICQCCREAQLLRAVQEEIAAAAPKPRQPSRIKR